MKKTLAMLLALAMSLSLLTGCGSMSLKLREPEEKKIPSVSNFQQTSNQIRASDVACFKYRESISLYLRDLGAIFP